MAHWRNSYKPSRFFFLDGRAGVVVLLSLIWIRPWTMTLVFFFLIAAYYIERLGMDVPSAIRAFRAMLAGNIRPALPHHKIRQPVDFGRKRITWEEPQEKGVITVLPIETKKNGARK